MNKDKKLYLILGILIVIFLFFLTEIGTPYLFLEDDNAKQFFPMILEGMKQLFSGYFPSMNLHQLMGTKLLETGTYPVLYPITIISYFFTHYILKNDFLMFETFALIHLILGFLFTFLFLNTKIKNYLICISASLAFIFSGYIFGLSRGWYYILPLIIFLPLILILNERLFKKRINNAILLGIVRGLFFYSGNAQYFVYALLFEFVYFLMKNYQEDWKNFSKSLKNYLISIVLTLILIFPLAWAQLITSKESLRGSISGLEYLLYRPALPTDVFIGGVFFPLLLPVSSFLFKFSSLHYSGTIFPLLFILGGFLLIKQYKKQSLKKISPLFWCGLLSIILSFGVLGILYSFGSLIPFVNNFRDPFKFIPFSNFFMISFGAIILSTIYEKKIMTKKILAFILIIFSLLLIGNIWYHSQKTQTNYFGDLPVNTTYFNDLNLEDYRIITVATNTEFDPKISSNIQVKISFPQVLFLNYNFATLFGLDHLSGYEPFKDKTSERISLPTKGVSNNKLNLSRLEEYNVKYILIFEESFEFHDELKNLNVLYQFPSGLNLLELQNTKGKIFSETQNLNYSRQPNGFTFNTYFEEPTNITVNLLYKKNYVVKINDEKTLFYKDNLGRIYLTVPEGENIVKVFYFPKDFVFGLFISFLLLIFFSIILILFRKTFKNIFSKIKNSCFKIKKIPFIKKRYLFLFILIAFFLLLFLTFSSVSNIEKLVSKRTGVNVEMENFNLKLFKGSLTIYNLNVSGSLENKNFYVDKIIFDLDKSKTLKNSMNQRKLLLYFNNITFENITFITEINKKNSNPLCKYPLLIYYSSEFENQTYVIKSDNFFIEDFLLIPINKAFFSFENKSFKLVNSNPDIFISADINFERYLNGNLSIYKKEGNLTSQRKCIVLPIESKTELYL